VNNGQDLAADDNWSSAQREILEGRWYP